MTTAPSFGDEVRAARRRAALDSQIALADAMEIRSATISHWERCEIIPAVRTIVQLAHVTGYPLTKLLAAAARTAEALSRQETRRGTKNPRRAA